LQDGKDLGRKEEIPPDADKQVSSKRWVKS